jgi:ribonuclease Z
MFLGTVSMKPTMYRNASAIYMFIKAHGILMDCAEGSYAQIYDHFQTKDKIDEAINKLRIVFITHIHGDHQLGIVKIMFERDRLLKDENPNNKLYVVTPKPMLSYLE